MPPSPAKFRLRLTPVTIAVTLAVLLVLWLLFGTKREALDEPPGEQQLPETELPLVESQWSEAQPTPDFQVLQGQVLPWQQVGIQAQITGRVVELLKRQGEPVEAGQALLRLSDEGRTERLRQAEADLRLRETDLASARALKSSQFVPQAELIRLEGALASARAELAAAQLAVEYNQPQAPFDGHVDRRHVEIGQLVQPGDALMDLVDINRLKATGFIPQQDAGKVQRGQQVELELLDGRKLQGEVAFVSLAADAQTRSFYVEVEVQNPELWRVAGASATLRIHLPAKPAHQITPSLLRLGEDGRLGVKALNAQQQVEFHPVDVIAIDGRHATVTGLPERVQLITLGAGFVHTGESVRVHEVSP